jgi:hypothetical protein
MFARMYSPHHLFSHKTQEKERESLITVICHVCFPGQYFNLFAIVSDISVMCHKLMGKHLDYRFFNVAQCEIRVMLVHFSYIHIRSRDIRPSHVGAESWLLPRSCRTVPNSRHITNFIVKG